MTHCVVDVSGIDHDGDGIVSRIYTGDLAGNMFAFKDDEVMFVGAEERSNALFWTCIPLIFMLHRPVKKPYSKP